MFFQLALCFLLLLPTFQTTSHAFSRHRVDSVSHRLDQPQALEAGAMSGQFFEVHVFGEIYKSFLNAGQRAPLYFFRNNDKKEIDLLMKRDGMLLPIEVKKTASPSRKDTRNLNALDPVNAPDVAPELSMRKREIGTGTIVCMAQDTFPASERARAFPAWAIYGTNRLAASVLATYGLAYSVQQIISDLCLHLKRQCHTLFRRREGIWRLSLGGRTANATTS